MRQKQQFSDKHFRGHKHHNEQFRPIGRDEDKQQKHKKHHRIIMGDVNAATPKSSRDIRSLSREISNINLGLSDAYKANNNHNKHHNHHNRMPSIKENQRKIKLSQQAKESSKSAEVSYVPIVNPPKPYPINVERQGGGTTRRLRIVANVQHIDHPTTRRLHVISNVQQKFEPRNKNEITKNSTNSRQPSLGTTTTTGHHNNINQNVRNVGNFSANHHHSQQQQHEQKHQQSRQHKTHKQHHKNHQDYLANSFPPTTSSSPSLLSTSARLNLKESQNPLTLSETSTLPSNNLHENSLISSTFDHNQVQNLPNHVGSRRKIIVMSSTNLPPSQPEADDIAVISSSITVKQQQQHIKAKQHLNSSDNPTMLFNTNETTLVDEIYNNYNDHGFPNYYGMVSTKNCYKNVQLHRKTFNLIEEISSENSKGNSKVDIFLLKYCNLTSLTMSSSYRSCSSLFILFVIFI